MRWNSRINLTAIRNEEEIVTRHFGEESLFAASHLFPALPRCKVFPPCPLSPCGRRSRRLPSPRSLKARSPRSRPGLSGAGFPGIPIKLWAPNITLTLIESKQKKSTFLREVARALTLTDINIQSARAETLPPSAFDVVTLRAVERLAEALPVAASLLAPSGRLALLIASSQLHQIHSTLPALTWQPPIPIPESRSRLLLIGSQEPGK